MPKKLTKKQRQAKEDKKATDKLKPKETEVALVKKMVRAINAIEYCHAIKIHGDVHQEKGIPDIIVCAVGKFIALEVKLPGKENKVSIHQELQLKRFREAMGVARAPVTSVKEAVKIVEKVIENAG